MFRDSIIPSSSLHAGAKPGVLTRLARGLLERRLDGLRSARVTLCENGVSRTFPRRGGAGRGFEVRVRDPRFYPAVAFGGALGAGEAYIAGHWSCSDLTGLFRVMLRDAGAYERLDAAWSRVTAPLHAIRHALRANTRSGSRRNIAAHYDLSNEFYGLLLDETMSYSCGIFDSPQTSLREASIAKMQRVCDQLRLGPGDHLLELGCGWGGLSLHAAQSRGCHVTGITVSPRQREAAAARVRGAGLDDRIEIALRDYRDQRGTFSAISSIEMIEAVGHEYYDTFFRACDRLLAAGGRMLLQAITIDDRLYESAKNRVDFIKRYVFPGCCIPSLNALRRSMERASRLRVVQVEDLTRHYAETLRRWRRAFFERIDEVRALGFNDAFIRLWEYYLCYCEAGFEERTIGNHQLLIERV